MKIETTETAVIKAGQVEVLPPVVEKALAALTPAEIERLDIAVRQITSAGINSESELRNADDIARQAKDHIETWNGLLEPFTKLLYANWNKWNTVRLNPVKKLQGYVDKLNRVMATYIDAERRRQEQEQERLRKLAEAEQADALKKARKLAAQGFIVQAQAIEQAAEAIIAPVLPDATPELEGTQIKGNWVVEVTDMVAFVKGVAAGVIPLEAIEVNYSFLRKRAIEQQGLTWPGVKAKKQTTFARKG